MLKVILLTFLKYLDIGTKVENKPVNVCFTAYYYIPNYNIK